MENHTKTRNEKINNYIETWNGKINNLSKYIEKIDGKGIPASAPLATYFSFLENDKKYGLVEILIGAKKYKKKDSYQTFYQMIAVIPENPEYPVLARNWEFGYIGGFRTYGYKKNEQNAPWYEKIFYITKYFDYNIPKEEMFTLKDLIKMDENLKYCAYRNNHYIDAIHYIRLYRKYPIAELLMKIGIQKMLEEKALEVISENKMFCKYLMKNKDDLIDRKSSFITAYNAFKKNPNGAFIDYDNSLKDRIMVGKAVALRNKELYKEILKHCSRESIIKYLQEKNINISTYEDYIEGCKFLHLDFSDTKNLFPKDFWKYHDNYTKQYAEYKRMLQGKEYEAITKKMEKTAEKFSYLNKSTNEYITIVAKNKKELIEEGEALNHCVGRMNYDKKQADEKSIIVFIRKTEQPQKSFVTLEVKITKKKLIANQCYGKNNCIVSEVNSFISSLLSKANQEYRKSLKKIA